MSAASHQDSRNRIAKTHNQCQLHKLQSRTALLLCPSVPLSANWKCKETLQVLFRGVMQNCCHKVNSTSAYNTVTAKPKILSKSV